MKWLRWQGLVAFVFVLAIVAGLWWWLADWWIARTIERIGSTTIGAQVDVENVDLRLGETAIRLQGLQITNAANPALNLIEIAAIDAQLDPAQLAWKRVHIETIDISGIQFNTTRKSPGWVSKDSSSGITQLVPELTSFDFAQLGNNEGALALLDSLELGSIQSMQAMQAEMKQSQAAFEQKMQQLPDEAKLKTYQERFNAIKAKDEGKGLGKGLQLLGKAKDADALRKEIKADIELVKSMREQVRHDYAQFKTRYAELKAAPAKDVEKLLSGFSFDAPGSDKLVSGVLGPELEARLQEGMSLYQTAEPWINKARVVAGQDVDGPPPAPRFEGVNVQFTERDPQPQFWLKKASLAGKFAIGTWSADFTGQLTDVSDAPALIHKPTELTLSGKGNSGGTLDLTLNVDTKNASPAMALRSKVQGVVLGPMRLSADPQLALATRAATVNGKLWFDTKGAQSALDLTLDFNQLALDISSSQSNDIVQNIVSELAKTESMQVQLKYLKEGEKQQRELKSSLDDIVKKAIRAALKKELAKHTEKAKAKLMAQAEKALGPLSESLSQFGGLEVILTETLGSLESALPSK